MKKFHGMMSVDNHIYGLLYKGNRIHTYHCTLGMDNRRSRLEQRRLTYRMKRLQIRRSVRYKLLAVVGLLLLAASAIFSADIWIAENEKIRRFGLTSSDSDEHDYSEEIDDFFDEIDSDKQHDNLITIREVTSNNMSDLATNMTNATNTTDATSTSTTAEPEEERPPPPRREFPNDLFTLTQRRRGAILLYVFGIIYMFSALALVCDDFFVPSLEIIIVTFKIPPDVAGATFMAAGGSAPEFFTSLVGIFFARNAIGFGTIVGSAVFNILFVIGVVGIVAKHSLPLTWWPLFRDTLFYATALAFLIGFFQNGLIEWYESLVLFFLYILYVLFMFINSPAERVSRKSVNYLQDKLCCCRCPGKGSRVQGVADSARMESGSPQPGYHRKRSSNSMQGSTIFVQPRNPANDCADVEIVRIKTIIL